MRLGQYGPTFDDGIDILSPSFTFLSLLIARHEPYIARWWYKCLCVSLSDSCCLFVVLQFDFRFPVFSCFIWLSTSLLPYWLPFSLCRLIPLLPGSLVPISGTGFFELEGLSQFLF